ncbi:MAG: SDR family NAD(P)-dependent oxidoreductase [Geminicoccaceae bacterium]
MDRNEEVSFGSFRGQMNVVVVGASGGIGAGMTEVLSGHPDVASVTACSRRGACLERANVRYHQLDIENEDTIAAVADRLKVEGRALDMVIVATGILHDGAALGPEKTWRSLDAATLEKVYRVNTIGPALIAKHFLPLLARDRKSVLAALSARVGSISDNQLGGWHAYRASKTALNMLIKNFAIELARRNPKALCVGLHPGTVNTGLSKPFQGNVPEGKLFAPHFVAVRLLNVLDDLTADDNGKLLAWDGKIIPC